MSTRDTDAAARFLRDDAPPPEGALLGRIALELGLLSADQLQGALRYLEQERAKGRDLQLGQVLLTFRYLSAEDLGRVLEEQRRRQEIATTLPSGAPTRIGSYEIVEEIGRGAMGFVYRAFDSKLKRTVALKTVREDRCDAAFLERFQREAVALARLHHPGIVTLYEAGMHRGLPFVAMEMVEGSPLEERLRRGRMPIDKAACIAEAAARAVHHAHGEGVIHRDLKPGNILLDREDHPRIVDFGLARVETDRIAMTMSGDVLGTPAYMAPEQVRGSRKQIDARTDVYALGAILYEMVTGRMPFSGRTAAELFEKILRGEPAPLRRFRAVPRDLEVICLKAMAKERERRYESAELLAEDLRRFQAGEPILARPPSVWYRLSRSFRRPSILIAASAAIVTTLGIWIVTRSLRSWSARRQAAETRQREQEGQFRRSRAEPYLERLRESSSRIRTLLRSPRIDAFEVQRVVNGAAEAHRLAMEICPDLPEAHVEMARLRLLIGHQAEAENHLGRALAVHQDHPLARLERGSMAVDDLERLSHFAESRTVEEDLRFESTQTDLRFALEQAPDESNRTRAEALLAYLKADHSRAAELLNLLAEREPDSFETQLRLGHALAHLGRRSEAQDILRRALALNPHYPHAELYLGWLLEELREYPAAIEMLTRRLARSSDYLAFVLRGRCRMFLKQFEAARSDFDEAEKLSPKSAQPWTLRSYVSLHEGDFPRAVQEATRAISLGPKTPHPYVYRAIASQSLNEPPQKAIEDLTRALKLVPPTPDAADAYNKRGYIFLEKTGELDRAIEDFTKSIELDPSSCSAFTNRAWARFRKGDYDGAVADAGSAIAIDGDDPAHFYGRARALGMMKRYADAVADLDRAIELRPTDDAAHVYRAEFRKCLFDFEGAIADCTTVLERTPSYEMAWCVRGWSHASLREYDRAVRDFDRSIELDGCSTAYCGRAYAHAKLGNVKQARRDAEAALRLGLAPDSRKIAEQILADLPPEGKTP